MTPGLILLGAIAYWLGPRAVLVLVALADALAAYCALRIGRREESPAPVLGREGFDPG